MAAETERRSNMTKQESAADPDSESPKVGTAKHAGSSKAAEGTTDKGNKHVVRIVGTYSLFTFLEEKGQRAFFRTITSEKFEKSLDYTAQYARSIEPFILDGDEKKFELRMTNMGFIREGFWRVAFPPIFQLTDKYVGYLPGCTNFELNRATQDRQSNKYSKAVFYRFCLSLLDQELSKIGGRREVHIGLNRFGIVNIGITIKWDSNANQSFEDLCKNAYTNVCHLQEDPLQDMAKSTMHDDVVRDLEQLTEPRLLVSYFQVLAITTIHRFLHDKLVDKAIHGFKKEWLANPWELSNKIPESTRYGLPPLRHVVFMYQLVHSISDKTSFLRNNRRALLTLGHNVGWSPSWNPPFPLFDSKQARLKDSSLLETSCCLIFPQGLVVVIPPDPDPASEDFQTVYPGGEPGNYSSVKVIYRDYWKLIFKLFIRVAEARLLIGMVTRELADIHKAFLKNRQALWGTRSLRVLIGWSKGKCGIDRTSKIHSRLMRVGSIIQRTSGRVITPEVTRYSFVRRKLTDFLETVNFEEHRRYIQSEFEKLNEWVIAIRTAWVARAAIVVAVLSVLVAVGTPWFQKWLNSTDDKSASCAEQSLPELIKGLSGEMDKLKTSTAAVNSELGNLQGKIEALAKDLETVKRCQHPSRKHTNVPPS